MKFFKALALGLTFAGAAALISCEGPAGPAGPAGPTGPEGPAGENAKCAECHHDSTQVLARMLQYEQSGHATLGHSARSDASCAPCHTQEGFMETIATGAQAASAKVANPTPPGCRGCHRIHETFTGADFALRTTAPVQLWASPGQTFDVGNSNLCARCHQARPSNPAPPTADQTGNYTITNSMSRFGPHYSQHAQMLLGTLGIHYQNGTPYPTSNYHKAPGCVTCHMAEPYGQMAGGHNMNVKYEYEGEQKLVSGCNGCHGNMTVSAEVTAMKAKWKATADEVQLLLDELKQQLIDKGIYNTANDLAKPGDYPANVAGAYWNYRVVYADHSHGIHNPQYAKALLKNTIAELKK